MGALYRTKQSSMCQMSAKLKPIDVGKQWEYGRNEGWSTIESTKTVSGGGIVEIWRADMTNMVCT